MRGRILKALAGDYWVKSQNDHHQVVARPRGIFRYEKQKPAVGDEVDLEGETITKIFPRKNLLKRPYVANVDQALLVFSVKDPLPDFLLLDKLMVNALSQGILPNLVVSKADLNQGEGLQDLLAYGDLLPVYVISNLEKESLDLLIQELHPGVYVLAGPSGVGKSSMINELAGKHQAPVGEISGKLKRGKHTTRHHELMDLGGDIYLVDTPGFQNLEVQPMDPLELKLYYPEFQDLEACQFDDCIHDQEPKCQVKREVQEGHILKSRYENYLRILADLRERKENQW